ncbi:hypothetical protein ACHAWF_014085 [Thalassiosira exigua]
MNMASLKRAHSPPGMGYRWKPQSFCIEAYDDPGVSSAPKLVDLVQFCPDTPSAHLQFGNPKADKRLYFDPELQNVSAIVKMMNEASCIENMYKVISASRKTASGAYIMCTCSRSTTRTYSEGKGEKCGFKLLVTHDDEHNQWYIRQNGGHCLEHNGHIPAANAHGPTVNALKRAKYEAKQERQRQSLQQNLAHPQSSWFRERECYAAFVTVEDVRDIRKLRSGCDNNATVERKTRLSEIAEWMKPFFDLKEMPHVSDGQERLFISEGTEAVRMMVQRCESAHAEVGSPTPVRLLAILSKPSSFFENPTYLMGDIEQRRFAGAPPFKIIIANEQALGEIAGFPIARGAMACGVVPDFIQQNGYDWLKELLSWEETRVPTSIFNSRRSLNKPIRRLLALDAISNAANLGSILRTAAAFAIDAIILSDDSCDAWYRQSVRVSLGHVVSLPTLRVEDWKRGLAKSDDLCDQEVNDLTGVIRWLRGRMNVECVAAVVDDELGKGFPPLVALEDEVCGNRSWCVVLGNEGHGIRDGVIRECDKRVKIGMASSVDSLSLPVAAGILMHQFCIQKK